MTFLNKWTFRLLLLLVAVIAVLIGADNSSSVTLRFMDFETFALPITWWMIAAFLLGVLVTWLVNMWTNTRLRLSARSAQRKVEATTRELEQARVAGNEPPAASVAAE